MKVEDISSDHFTLRIGLMRYGILWRANITSPPDDPLTAYRSRQPWRSPPYGTRRSNEKQGSTPMQEHLRTMVETPRNHATADHLDRNPRMARIPAQV